MHFLNESFLLAICFVIFVLLIYKVAKKTILNILDSKIEEVKSSVEEAITLRQDAKETLKQTLKEISGIKNLKKEILDNAAQDIDRSIQLLEKNLNNDLDIKKTQMIEFIEDRRKIAYEGLVKQFNDNTIKLVTEYLKATNNEDLSDLEIAKLIKN